MLENIYFIFCGTGPNNLMHAHSGFDRFSEQLQMRGINGHFLAPPPLSREIDFELKPADFYEQDARRVQEWLEDNFPSHLDPTNSLAIVFEPIAEVKEAHNELSEGQRHNLLKRLYPNARPSPHKTLPSIFYNRFIQSALLSNPGIKNLICIVGHESMGVNRTFLSELNYSWIMLALTANEVNLNATTSLFAAFSALEIAFSSNKTAVLDRQILLNTESNCQKVAALLSTLSDLKLANERFPQRIDRSAPSSKNRLIQQIELTTQSAAKRPVNIVMVASDNANSSFRTKPVFASLPKAARFTNFIPIKFTLKVLFPIDTKSIMNFKEEKIAHAERNFLFLSQNVIEMLELKKIYFSQGELIPDLKKRVGKIKTLLKSSSLTAENRLQLEQEKTEIFQNIINLPYNPSDNAHSLMEVLTQQIEETSGEVVLCISPKENITHLQTIKKENSLSTLEQPNLFFLARDEQRSYEQYVSFLSILADRISHNTQKKIGFYLMPSEGSLDSACGLFSKLPYPELIGPIRPLSALKSTLNQPVETEKRTAVYTPIQRVTTKKENQSWSQVHRNFLGEISTSSKKFDKPKPIPRIEEVSEATTSRSMMAPNW